VPVDALTTNAAKDASPEPAVEVVEGATSDAGEGRLVTSSQPIITYKEEQSISANRDTLGASTPSDVVDLDNIAPSIIDSTNELPHNAEVSQPNTATGGEVTLESVSPVLPAQTVEPEHIASSSESIATIVPSTSPISMTSDIVAHTESPSKGDKTLDQAEQNDIAFLTSAFPEDVTSVRPSLPATVTPKTKLSVTDSDGSDWSEVEA
jgi:hypothetical protein